MVLYASIKSKLQKKKKKISMNPSRRQNYEVSLRTGSLLNKTITPWCKAVFGFGTWSIVRRIEVC